ncbi:MAG TPA: hypothetical protein VH207_04330 [Chthoniobacterales bacterium]|jgi:hypothetical protein|nr:hypothetical protein [Chthoniobacterales bacterium]
MFYFRIDGVRFVDNGGIKSGLGFFGHDFAKVKFLSFISRSDQNFPELDAWMQSNNPADKRTMLEALVNQTLSTRELTEIDRVQDKVPVRFGDTGLILHESEEIPEAFTWIFLAIRSSRDIREAASDINDVLNAPDFSAFTSSLLSLIQGASAVANPAYAAAIQAARFVAQVSARRLMKKGDQQLGAVYESFIRPEHYPQGIREGRDVPDTTGNMFCDYSLFGYRRALPVLDEPKAKPKAKPKPKPTKRTKRKAKS